MLLSASPRIIPHLDPLPSRKGEEARNAAAAHCCCNRQSDIALALLEQFEDGCCPPLPACGERIEVRGHNFVSHGAYSFACSLAD
jgi:hypothetical protein